MAKRRQLRQPGHAPARAKRVAQPVGLMRRVLAIRDRISPELPDIDPGLLLSIIECHLRPIGRSGRSFLLKQIRPGVYAF